MANDKGDFLVAANGMTVYTFKNDKADSGESACYDKCAEAWPPVLADSPVAGKGATGKLGTIKRTDGKMQVTYNGWPLYFFVKDKAAGDKTGDGVGKVWFVVKP